APEETDSPAGAYAVATFPSGGSSSVEGSVSFSANSNGAVEVSVDISGLPSEGYPFLYHIHTHTVPSSGNCTAALGHFNPFNASTPCSKTDGVDTCELGDLSGKWETFNTSSYSTSYVDPYLSLNTDSEAYIGNLSIVFHYHNTSRIACANLKYSTNGSTATTSASQVSTAGATS
ncbi:hypothetical protein CANARDRAFT_179210, partial [[Candida] arabinofermentans NRRL YB-2248]